MGSMEELLRRSSTLQMEKYYIYIVEMDIEFLNL